MTTTELKAIAPLATLVPPPRNGDVLSEEQWTTLLAIADTIIPSVTPPTDVERPHTGLDPVASAATVEGLQKWMPKETSTTVAQEYLQETPSSLPNFKILLSEILGDLLRPEAVKGIKVILSSLNTRAGCLLTTGYTTPFHLQPPSTRELIIQNWSRSYLPPLRSAARAFSSLLGAVWIKTSPTLGPVIGFPRAPVHGTTGQGFKYDFLQFPPGDQPETLDADVVIVGSGCGGGVCAKNLSESGLRVIVVEKGYHWGPEYLPMTEKDAGPLLFANGGAIATDDGSVTMLTAQVWGGGGSVNWSASLQTPYHVRQEWADDGLPLFTSPAFQSSLDTVCERMGVSTKHIRHNTNNQLLREGARRLGYDHKDVPQNTGGKEHYCGYCQLGCGAAEKQGPVVSFLPDAARAGARLIEGFSVDKVLFDNSTGTKQATGIQGSWTSRDSLGGVSRPTEQYTRNLTINAKRVIISAGSLSSPLILLRSGLTNPQIGRNLHLHPTTIITSVYGDSPHPLNPWEGGILTTAVDEFQNQDGHGHGVKLEALTMIPSVAIAFQAWRSGRERKIMSSRLGYTASHIALVRDRDTGRVFPDPVDGRVRIAYTPSAFDVRHAIEGAIALAKIAYIQGATEIMMSTHSIPVFKKSNSPQPPSSSPDPATAPIPTANPTATAAAGAVEDSDPNVDAAFQEWLGLVRRNGFRDPVDTIWGCAHIMGTCRMSASARSGVVDQNGRVWGTEGLYVADASTFPSASGVNPMVTTMAIANCISREMMRQEM